MTDDARGLMVEADGDVAPDFPEARRASSRRRRVAALAASLMLLAVGIVAFFNVAKDALPAASDVSRSEGLDVLSGDLCPAGFFQEGCSEDGHYDADCCAQPGHGGCMYGQAGALGALCAANGARATCCEKLVPVDPAPRCPWGYVRAGCFENGQVDLDCCAKAGEGSCMVSSNMTQGKVCAPNGAVATCCEPAKLPDVNDKSLFCFSVALNHGYEADLTRSHHAKRRSIFACNEWSVFSDGPMPPVPTTNIGAFRSPPAPWKGGSYANTRLFVRAYSAVFAENKWSRHGWTVKADPDAVWFPNRLVWHLKPHGTWPPTLLRPPGIGATKWYGGPLEVLSAYAVMKLVSRRAEECNLNLDNSPEDGWLAMCLGRIGVQSVFDGALLRWTANPGQCHDGWIVNFHPFKNVGAWDACERASR